MRKQQIIILGVVFGLSLLGLILLQMSYFQAAFEVKKEQFYFSVHKAMDEVATYIRDKEKEYRTAREDDLLDENGDKESERMHVDPKQPVSSKNDVTLMMGSTLNMIDDHSGIEDVSNFVRSLGQENNLFTSISKLQKEIQKRLGKEFKLIRETDGLDRLIEGNMDLENLYWVIGNYLKDNGIRSNFEFGIKEKGKFIYTSKDFMSSHTEYGFDKKIFPDEGEEAAVLYLEFPDLSDDSLRSFWMLLPSMLITIALVLCSMFCLVVIIRQKKLSAIKNDFINNMTHEFKTPIATISLAAQMLQDGVVTDAPDTIGRVATIIRDESKRLTFQVEQVLQTALFTETRMKLKLKKLEINELIEDLFPKFALRVEDKGGKIFENLQAKEDEVYGDEVHITNVISNLVDNAIKYCTKSPEINIYTYNKNQEIVISVIDNGIGIAKKDQKLIFERFYRVSTGNLHDVKGFGLGLSYVKKIVEAHGGRIEVESSLEKGSCFKVILPLTSKKQKVRRTLFF